MINTTPDTNTDSDQELRDPLGDNNVLEENHDSLRSSDNSDQDEEYYDSRQSSDKKITLKTVINCLNKQEYRKQ